MKLFYWASEEGNVGDDLNPWLFSRLVPEILDDDASRLLVGIGTILDQRIPKTPEKYIFGSGVRYPRPVFKDSSWKIYALRGPLSAERLGEEPKKAIADPAILVRNLFAGEVSEDRRTVVYVPYFRSARSPVWRKICENLNFYYLDPRVEVEAFLKVISNARLVISEAMHGAIIADAFRVPWIPVQSFSRQHEGETNDFKWSDWCASMGVPFTPTALPCIWPQADNVSRKGRLVVECKTYLAQMKLHRLVSRGTQFMSADRVIDSKMNQLYDALDELRRDVVRGS